MKLGPWPVQLTLLGFFVFCSADSLICAPVTFDLGEVTAQPGQAEVSLPLSLDVGSEEYAVSGWLVIVRYDPAILGNVRLEETRGAQRAWPTDQAEFVEPGTVSLAVVYSLTQRVEITPANDGVVANLRFCVLETAAPLLPKTLEELA